VILKKQIDKKIIFVCAGSHFRNRLAMGHTRNVIGMFKGVTSLVLNQ